MTAPVPRDWQPRRPFEERYLAEARRICLEMVPAPREVFLFGSRARGHCEYSIDIGIAGGFPAGSRVARQLGNGGGGAMDRAILGGEVRYFWIIASRAIIQK
jgi:hypothetical protein